MSLLLIIGVIIVVGFLVWLALKFIPMPPAFAQALPWIALGLILVWIFFGVFGGRLPDVIVGG